MTLFITSSPSVSMDGAINPENWFLDELYRTVGHMTRGVFVSSHPDDAGYSDHCGYCMKQAFDDAGIHFYSYTILDRRTASRAEEIIRNSDFVILGGGHVPTQNDFLMEINLGQLLRRYRGVVMGISAGSMNMADMVYSIPEEPGEAVDKDYKRFIKGLGLTRSQIIPHYYMEKDMVVDDQRLFEEIAFPDSMGHRFYALPDGSYIYSENGLEELRGEAYVIENGTIRQVSEVGQRVPLSCIF